MAKEIVVVKEKQAVSIKPYIIFGNALISAGLAFAGLLGMISTDRVAGVIREWSTLIWVLGLVSAWLIPLEILFIRPSREKRLSS